MPLNQLLKKASSLFLGSPGDEPASHSQEGEVIFCKNNVCVHPASVLRHHGDASHQPGYLTVSVAAAGQLRLTWLPNAALRSSTEALPEEGGGAAVSWSKSSELAAEQRALVYPESPAVSRRTHRFSVMLGEMHSVRVFFGGGGGGGGGQLVVASRDSQYKILHFHHSGLDRLAALLAEWMPAQGASTDSPAYRHFLVCRPQVSSAEMHPEEGSLPPLDRALWDRLVNEEGQILDELAVRKHVFFGGLDPAMRSEVWPFLLGCFPFASTARHREHVRALRRLEYKEITRRRLEMDAGSQEAFWRRVQCVVEKDVVRTDRSCPFYAGDNNPNVDTMMDILLNHAVYQPSIGYSQGMSDLLAPLLAELRDETEAFWSFAALMRVAWFVVTPTDSDMDTHLRYLRELIRIMAPAFYQHLLRHPGSLDLLFCHRWILLCFKREFPLPAALTLWEACWADWLTEHFHLFLCLAIVAAYADDVIARDLRADETLLHFSSLAMFMDAALVLRTARGLLHRFRALPRVPCSLRGLLAAGNQRNVWDSASLPSIECECEDTCQNMPDSDSTTPG